MKLGYDTIFCGVRKPKERKYNAKIEFVWHCEI